MVITLNNSCLTMLLTLLASPECAKKSNRCSRPPHLCALPLFVPQHFAWVDHGLHLQGYKHQRKVCHHTLAPVRAPSLRLAALAKVHHERLLQGYKLERKIANTLAPVRAPALHLVVLARVSHGRLLQGYLAAVDAVVAVAVAGH